MAEQPRETLEEVSKLQTEESQAWWSNRLDGTGHVILGTFYVHAFLRFLQDGGKRKNYKTQD
jgi:hypothetical protein